MFAKPAHEDLSSGIFILGAKMGPTSLLATGYKWPECSLQIEPRFLTIKTPQATSSILQSDVRNVSFVSGGLIIQHESAQAPQYIFLTTLEQRLIEKRLKALKYPIKPVEIVLPDRGLARLFYRFIPLYIVSLAVLLIFVDHNPHHIYRAMFGMGILVFFVMIYTVARIFYPSYNIRNYQHADSVRRFLFCVVGIIMTMNVIYVHSSDRIPFFTHYEQRRIAGLAAQVYIGRSPAGLTDNSDAKKIFQPKIYTRVQGEVDAKMMEIKLDNLHISAEITNIRLMDDNGMTQAVVTGICNITGTHMNNQFRTRKPFTFYVLFGPAPDHDEEVADYHIEIQ